MKKICVYLLSLGAICHFLIGCQTATLNSKHSGAKPTAGEPLPTWVNRETRAQSDQQFHLTTKIIEITRPVGSADLPLMRYGKKLSASQFQSFIRDISKRKGVDLMTAPSVIVQDGKNASVEVVREFLYPLEVGDGSQTEIEKVGVTSHFNASHLGGNDILIKAFTRVSEFQEFSEVAPEFSLPVFERRDVENSARLKSGETILVGGILSESFQKVEDKGLLGIVTKRSTQKLSRELVVAVTASLIAPE